MPLAVVRGAAVAAALIAFANSATAAGDSALSEEKLPLQVDQVDQRPQPIEAGEPFLGTGVIGPGFRLPTGAVWQPQILIWGELRTAVHAFDNEGDSDQRRSQWASRLDLFAELEVSPTERVVVGFRPFDEDGRFSGCVFEDPVFDEDCDGHHEEEPSVAFVEANFAELFPLLDPDDTRALDIEFAVGRQPLIFQDGFLISDTLDAVTVARNNIALPGTTNTRIAGAFAWNNIDRGTGSAGRGSPRGRINPEDGNALLFGLFVETDVPWSTINFDIAFVKSDDDPPRGSSLNVGLSFIQRIGKLNTAFRALLSQNFDRKGDAPRPGRRQPAALDGGLLFAEFNYVPAHTHNNVYFNLFVGIDQYTSAARAPAAGGPLGLTGILFGTVGLGTYGAPLGSTIEDAVGGALGYQMFFSNNRRWLTVELGGRGNWNNDSYSAVGLGASFQQALFRRVILRTDGFIGHIEHENFGWGTRAEILVRF